MTTTYAGGLYGTHERETDALWLTKSGGWVSRDADGRLPGDVRRFTTSEEATQVSRALWPGSHGVGGALSDPDGNFYRSAVRPAP